MKRNGKKPDRLGFTGVKLITIISLVMSCFQGHCQGTFLFLNASAPTRVGTIDGPLAGPDYWAQMLAGPTPEGLLPVGMSRQHVISGIAGGVIRVTVPGVPCLDIAYVQMLAWDGRFWGSSLDSVPQDQLGRTDVVPTYLSCDPLPVGAPRFTQPAIVPPIPEPSGWALALMGSAGWLWFRRYKVEATELSRGQSCPRSGVRPTRAQRGGAGAPIGTHLRALWRVTPLRAGCRTP
jgi:hypothetical protein